MACFEVVQKVEQWCCKVVQAPPLLHCNTLSPLEAESARDFDDLRSCWPGISGTLLVPLMGQLLDGHCVQVEPGRGPLAASALKGGAQQPQAKGALKECLGCPPARLVNKLGWVHLPKRQQDSCRLVLIERQKVGGHNFGALSDPTHCGQIGRIAPILGPAGKTPAQARSGTYRGRQSVELVLPVACRPIFIEGVQVCSGLASQRRSVHHLSAGNNRSTLVGCFFSEHTGFADAWLPKQHQVWAVSQLADTKHLGLTVHDDVHPAVDNCFLHALPPKRMLCCRPR